MNLYLMKMIIYNGNILYCLYKILIARLTIMMHFVKFPVIPNVLSVRVPPTELNISAFSPVLRNWVIKGLGMSSRVYATRHIKDPVPLIEKRRGLSAGGQFPTSFIHQVPVIIITGLNKLYDCYYIRYTIVLARNMASEPNRTEYGLRCRMGVKLKLKTRTQCWKYYHKTDKNQFIFSNHYPSNKLLCVLRP